VEGPGCFSERECASGRGCSWESVACAIEDLVWDEVVLNRGVEQIVPAQQTNLGSGNVSFWFPERS